MCACSDNISKGSREHWGSASRSTVILTLAYWSRVACPFLCHLYLCCIKSLATPFPAWWTGGVVTTLNKTINYFKTRYKSVGFFFWVFFSHFGWATEMKTDLISKLKQQLFSKVMWSSTFNLSKVSDLRWRVNWGLKHCNLIDL